MTGLTVSPAPLPGPSFFAAVTVSLAVDVSPDQGGSAPVDRVECVYEKLVSLFGLGAAPTGWVAHLFSRQCCNATSLSVVRSLKIPFYLRRFVQ